MENKKMAFTLAEVLITLTIIGVIAAITIPNLMQSWRKHERITQIKTAYSIIQNATKMAIAEYGNPDGWDFGSAWNYTPKYFTPYVKTQKLCGMATYSAYNIGKGCFIDNDKNGDWYYLNGNLASTEANGYRPDNYYTMILQNGMHLGIWAPSKGNQSSQRHILFLVDVDGKKGVTKAGHDIFTFAFNLDTGKFTTGTTRSGAYNGNDCINTKGLSCARAIEQNHWEFPDNYPVKKF